VLHAAAAIALVGAASHLTHPAFAKELKDALHHTIDL
jgi:hypothetical protein